MNLKKILFSKEFLKFCSFEYGISSVDLLKYSRVDLFSRITPACAGKRCL